MMLLSNRLRKGIGGGPSVPLVASFVGRWPGGGGNATTGTFNVPADGLLVFLASVSPNTRDIEVDGQPFDGAVQAIPGDDTARWHYKEVLAGNRTVTTNFDSGKGSANSGSLFLIENATDPVPFLVDYEASTGALGVTFDLSGETSTAVLGSGAGFSNAWSPSPFDGTDWSGQSGEVPSAWASYDTPQGSIAYSAGNATGGSQNSWFMAAWR